MKSKKFSLIDFARVILAEGRIRLVEFRETCWPRRTLTIAGDALKWSDDGDAFLIAFDTVAKVEKWREWRGISPARLICRVSPANGVPLVLSESDWSISGQSATPLPISFEEGIEAIVVQARRACAGVKIYDGLSPGAFISVVLAHVSLISLALYFVVSPGDRNAEYTKWMFSAYATVVFLSLVASFQAWPRRRYFRARQRKAKVKSNSKNETLERIEKVFETILVPLRIAWMVMFSPKALAREIELGDVGNLLRGISSVILAITLSGLMLTAAFLINGIAVEKLGAIQLLLQGVAWIVLWVAPTIGLFVVFRLWSNTPASLIDFIHCSSYIATCMIVVSAVISAAELCYVVFLVGGPGDLMARLPAGVSAQILECKPNQNSVSCFYAIWGYLQKGPDLVRAVVRVELIQSAFFILWSVPILRGQVIIFERRLNLPAVQVLIASLMLNVLLGLVFRGGTSLPVAY